MKDINEEVELEYYCDTGRHVVCIPYSIPNLHRMAIDLGLKKSWFHRKRKFHHYDMPVRMEKEIMARCNLVSGQDIVRICKGEPIKTQIN